MPPLKTLQYKGQLATGDQRTPPKQCTDQFCCSTITILRLVRFKTSVVWPLSLPAAAGCNALFCWSLDSVAQRKVTATTRVAIYGVSMKLRSRPLPPFHPKRPTAWAIVNDIFNRFSQTTSTVESIQSTFPSGPHTRGITTSSCDRSLLKPRCLSSKHPTCLPLPYVCYRPLLYITSRSGLSPLSLAITLHPQPSARLRRALFFLLFRALTRLGPTEDDSPQEEREEGYPVLPDGLRSIWHW